MAERSRNKPEWQLKIARERIGILFDEATKTTDKKLQKRYMQLAKKIGMRYNVRLGSLKRKFCKHCYSYFTSSNSSYRLKNGRLRIKCFSCGKLLQIPYKGRRS